MPPVAQGVLAILALALAITLFAVVLVTVGVVR